MPEPLITSLDVFGSCRDHFIITKSQTITNVMDILLEAIQLLFQQKALVFPKTVSVCNSI